MFRNLVYTILTLLHRLIRMTKEMLEPFAKAWKTPILYIEADEGFKLFNPVYPDSITLLDEAPTVQIAKMKVRISLNGLFKG